MGSDKAFVFDPEMLDGYRRAWRDPATIHGSCSDDRAAASIDLAHDDGDIDREVACLALVFYGGSGAMARLFDSPAEWRKPCEQLIEISLPGGRSFVDQFPDETARTLIEFLERGGSPKR